ncbi:hypothetical protein M2266_004705 [Streptomyces sp. SPB162]|nr:hypothetical protein [Streptomyces sp. SPB162]
MEFGRRHGGQLSFVLQLRRELRVVREAFERGQFPVRQRSQQIDHRGPVVGVR